MAHACGLGCGLPVGVTVWERSGEPFRVVCPLSESVRSGQWPRQPITRRAPLWAVGVQWYILWLHLSWRRETLRFSTNMAALVGQSSARNDSTLTTEWPKAFDIKNDIFTPGLVDRFKREMRAALSTRGLLEHVLNRPVTMIEIAGVTR